MTKMQGFTMAKAPILVVLLQLFYTLLEVSGQQSPCPEYFSYILNSATNEVMGQIQIPSPPKNVELHLKVALSIGAALPTSYVGKLKLAYSKEESVRLVERGPDATGQVVTSITLEHTLYPHVLPLSGNSNLSPNWPDPTIVTPVYPTSRPSNPPIPYPIYEVITERPTNRPPITPRTMKPIVTITQPPYFYKPQHFECGINNQPVNINLLISKGQKTDHWPWLVALFIRIGNSLEFQCAGSILTQKHIITAAHCCKQGGRDISPNIMSASFEYRLKDGRQGGPMTREISSCTPHPDYNHQGGCADSDLAILTLKYPVEFTSTIKPICMWYDSVDLDSVVNKLGYIVGWGADEHGNSNVDEPRIAEVPIVSQTTCLWSDQRFSSFTSDRTFCAGKLDDSGPCNGDSGSALMLYDYSIRRYQLRGIVSRSLIKYGPNGQNRCDLSHYVIFVDVAKYLSWIYQQIST